MLVMLWMPLQAQPVPDAARDHPLLERFGESEIVEYRVENDVNYQLVLGNMRRLAGRVVPEESERLRGNLTRITYEVPQGFSAADVMEYFRAQVDERGYSNLFSCSGRGCGNSNYWANDVFDNRTLYGPERNQYYMALQADGDGDLTGYLAIYVITRANRQLYAHVEILESSERRVTPMVEFSAENLEEFRSLRLFGLEFDSSDRLVEQGGIQAAVQLLHQNPSLSVYVVAHLPGPGDLDELLARSGQRADQVRELLLEQGIAGGRVVARGIGPLSPLCSEGDCGERVELVLR